MSIAGNLRTMDLAELLQWLSQGTKTGTLTIDSGSVEKKIFFDKGKIISSASTDPKEHLGHFLVSHGHIDEVTLAKVIDMQAANRMLLGKILITVGAISEPDLNRMLRLKAEESIYEIFSWKEGDFRFADDALPGLPMVPITLDVTGIVLEGARRQDEWAVIRKQIPSMDAVPVAVAGLVAPDERKGSQKILDSVNDDRTIAEIALENHASEFFTCRTLYDQVRAGKLKIVRRRWIRKNHAPEAQEEVGSGALLASAGVHMKAKDFSRALRHLEAAQALEPNDAKFQARIAGLQRRIDSEITAAGIVDQAIPKLSRPASEIVELNITPEQGFILSRIDGTYTIETILKISPMPTLHARVVFWSLLTAGHIKL